MNRCLYSIDKLHGSPDEGLFILTVVCIVDDDDDEGISNEFLGRN